MKKKIVWIFLGIWMMIRIASAEGINKSMEDRIEQIYQATMQMNSWIEELDKKREKMTDEDSNYFLSDVRENLSFYQAVLSKMQDAQSGLEDYPSYSWSRSETDEGTITTLQAAPSQGVTGTIYVCKAEYTENDYRVEMETYDEEGNPLHRQRLEMAAKDDEMMVMLLDYNTELDILSKFATWIQADDAQTIYLLVFGDQEEIRLNPRAWSNDHQTFETWDDTLLMPTAL